MLCPRCDQQGLLVRVRINATGEQGLLCDECDAFWPDGIEVGDGTFIDFSTYVASWGLQGLWSEVTELGGEA